MPTAPCETWTEALSLLAAGCLTADEEPRVRQHLAECAGCRERFEQLAALCGSLAADRPEWEPRGADVVARAMKRIETHSFAEEENVELNSDVAARSARDGESRCYGIRSVPTTLRWKLLVGGLLAASLLIVMMWRSFFHTAPETPQVVQPEAPGAAADPEQPPPLDVPTRQVAAAPRPAPAPTWLALQRAAAESDEALENLLAGGNDSVIVGTLDNPTLHEELNR